MGGGTQLFEGAHLTGTYTHFCCKSGKCSNSLKDRVFGTVGGLTYKGEKMKVKILTGAPSNSRTRVSHFYTFLS